MHASYVLITIVLSTIVCAEQHTDQRSVCVVWSGTSINQAISECSIQDNVTIAVESGVYEERIMLPKSIVAFHIRPMANDTVIIVGSDHDFTAAKTVIVQGIQWKAPLRYFFRLHGSVSTFLSTDSVFDGSESIEYGSVDIGARIG